MPDFLRWLLNAAKPGKPLPPGEFLWSPSKHFLFRKCPRAWFFRHYLAQGGWSDLSAAPSRHAYLLKYLSTVDSWMSAAAEESLTGALQDISQTTGGIRAAELTDAFQIRISSHLIQARDELVNRDYQNDPKRTSFYELHCETGEYRSISELLLTIRNRFQKFFHFWEDSELAAEIVSLDPLAWRLPPEHRIFPYAGLNISLRPWIYAVHQRFVTAWVFRFCFSDHEYAALPANGEEYGLPEQVFAAWCQQKYPEFEVRIRKIIMTPEGMINRTEKPLPLNEDFVIQSAFRMLDAAISPDGIAAEKFPKLKNPEECRGCRFKELCETQPAPEEEAEEKLPPEHNAASGC